MSQGRRAVRVVAAMAALCVFPICGSIFNCKPMTINIRPISVSNSDNVSFFEHAFIDHFSDKVEGRFIRKHGSALRAGQHVWFTLCWTEERLIWANPHTWNLFCRLIVRNRGEITEYKPMRGIFYLTWRFASIDEMISRNQKARSISVFIAPLIWFFGEPVFDANDFDIIAEYKVRSFGVDHGLGVYESGVRTTMGGASRDSRYDECDGNNYGTRQTHPEGCLCPLGGFRRSICRFPFYTKVFIFSILGVSTAIGGNIGAWRWSRGDNYIKWLLLGAASYGAAIFFAVNIA